MISGIDVLSFRLLIHPLLLGGLVAAAFAVLYSFTSHTTSTGAAITYGQKIKTNLLQALGFSIPTSIIAYAAGYLTGISRSPAAGSVIPAMLALIGGLNIYVFGAEVRNRAAVGLGVFLFGIIFFESTLIGSYDREYGLERRLTILSDQEKRIRTYRMNRDLPAEPPWWLFSVESRQKEKEKE